MQADDQIAEWLVRWEEARAANRPPPSLDQLPQELRPRAREGLQLLRGFVRMSHGLITTAPTPPGDAPEAPPNTPRYHFEAFLARGGMGEVWRGCDTLLAREVALACSTHCPVSSRYGETFNLVTSSDHADTTVVLSRSVSNRLETPGLDALVDSSYRRDRRCLDSWRDLGCLDSSGFPTGESLRVWIPWVSPVYAWCSFVSRTRDFCGFARAVGTELRNNSYPAPERVTTNERVDGIRRHYCESAAVFCDFGKRISLRLTSRTAGVSVDALTSPNPVLRLEGIPVAHGSLGSTDRKNCCLPPNRAQEQHQLKLNE